MVVLNILTKPTRPQRGGGKSCNWRTKGGGEVREMLTFADKWGKGGIPLYVYFVLLNLSNAILLIFITKIVLIVHNLYLFWSIINIYLVTYGSYKPGQNKFTIQLGLVMYKLMAILFIQKKVLRYHLWQLGQYQKVGVSVFLFFFKMEEGEKV